MRILNFQIRWQKLFKLIFTTFRYPRKDRDYEVDETVKIVYRQRSPYREELGIAKIIKKEKEWIITNPPYNSIPILTDEEAIEDGFESRADMYKWMKKQYGNRVDREPMNKLTLKRER